MNATVVLIGHGAEFRKISGRNHHAVSTGSRDHPRTLDVCALSAFA